MSQNRHIAGSHQFEKEIFEPDRRNVVRGLNQDIARLGECQQMPRPQTGSEGGDDVVVGACHQPQRNAFLFEDLRELCDQLANLRTGIMIYAGQDVRRTSGH
jgi:hypothetical protein